MSASGRAIFLSYASQDAEAAHRICEALREAGLEVWFDQSELRGGDAWDASIRRQIQECALFVPVISANTDTRSEGYFRLEWKLAVDRSHLMADDQAFLLPVVIDATLEANARVPAKFREVQWTHLPTGVVPAAFAERVQHLLSGGTAPRRAAMTRRAVAAAAPAVAAAAREPPSIAVLPFVNMSHDAENEYFADGLAEELLNVLSKIRGLRVVSRTSAFHFKGKDIDLVTVAQKLNVATILEGSVRKSGKHVRIAAQLIEVASDSHLWSATYDRELEDIFTMQDDIAQSVVKELRNKLLGEAGDAVAAEGVRAEVAAAVTGRGENVEAYRLYLQGRFHMDHGTRASMGRAIDCFKRAVKIDPDFALGWAGLSDGIRMQVDLALVPAEACMEDARQAALRSIALAPNLAEGHVALGRVLTFYDLNWKAADAEFQRALELAPGNADVMRSVAFLAKCFGRKEEGVEFARRASELDPLSVKILRIFGVHCATAGRFDEAHSAFASALALDPRAGLVNNGLAMLLLFEGRYGEALAAAEREVVPAYRLWGVAVTQYALGDTTASDAVLEELIEDYPDTMAASIAQVMAYRGRTDEAFAWLERAYRQRDPGLGPDLMDIGFESLRGDPRLQAFLQKVGLP